MDGRDGGVEELLMAIEEGMAHETDLLAYAVAVRSMTGPCIGFCSTGERIEQGGTRAAAGGWKPGNPRDPEAPRIHPRRGFSNIFLYRGAFGVLQASLPQREAPFDGHCQKIWKRRQDYKP